MDHKTLEALRHEKSRMDAAAHELRVVCAMFQGGCNPGGLMLNQYPLMGEQAAVAAAYAQVLARRIVAYTRFTRLPFANMPLTGTNEFSVSRFFRGAAGAKDYNGVAVHGSGDEQITTLLDFVDCLTDDEREHLSGACIGVGELRLHWNRSNWITPNWFKSGATLVLLDGATYTVWEDRK